MHYVYFIQSQKSEKIYVGSTGDDPRVRLKQHNSGSNSFTKCNCPYKLIYYEKYFCKEDAKIRENFYKSGFGRNVKKAIVETLKTWGGSSIG